MLTLLRRLLLDAIVRPLAHLGLGLSCTGRQHLPLQGPAIIAANHNSHIDTLVLMSLFPSRLLPKLRPLAAADHFLRDPVSSWFARTIVGIIPLQRDVRAAARTSPDSDVLAEAKAALADGAILIVFPEGSRGTPEEMGVFKAGVARLAEACPQAPVVPVYIQGAGRALPRESRLFVPFSVSVIAGEAIAFDGSRKGLIDTLRSRIEGLKALAPPLHWD
jgi:1-acyl-sn-glycerol-3-phosphate acyltransferase